MPQLKEMRDQRGKTIAEARAILDKAKEEKRDLSQEENARYEKLIEETNSLKQRIDREERQREMEREAAEAELRRKDEGKDPEKRGDKPEDKDTEYRNALNNYIKRGFGGLNEAERRALSVGLDTEGGYFVGEQMADGILKAVDDLVFIRSRATKYRIPSAASLGKISLDNDPDDADWTTELAIGSEDRTMSFGKRKLEPNPFGKLMKISNELLQKVPGIESFVRQRLAYKFAITEEKGFMTGNGAGKPLGLFTASNDGIPTSRDVSTGNTATEIRFDGLIEAKYTLKQQYWGRADWIFHRDAMKQIAKLKDGEGQYLWRQSVREGEPDTLLGRPFMMSEYAPNTFTTGLYVGIIGDFSYYAIADATDMVVQRLVELYAATNQTGLIGRASCDGMPFLSEAFVRVTLGS